MVKIIVLCQQYKLEFLTPKKNIFQIEEEANGDIFDIEIGVSDPEKVGESIFIIFFTLLFL